MSQPKQEIIARLYTEDGNSRYHHSDYATVGINFSVVEKGTLNQRSDPTFVTSFEYHLNKYEQLTNLVISSEVKKGRNEPEDNPFYGTAYAYGSLTNVPLARMERFVRVARPLLKKAEKVADTISEPFSEFPGFSMAVLKAMGVTTVLFESYSEQQGFSRWKSYSLSELPVLLNKAKSEAGLMF